MQVLITGATGSVGRALARVLRREGHDVLAAVRNVERAQNVLGPEIALFDIEDERALSQAVERADAIVNLAGEGIANRPWTDKRKRELSASRVGLTRRLSEHVRRAQHPPRVFVSASAIGIYGDAGEMVQDEYSAPARDFMGELCASWEEAALRSRSAKTRVVCLRIGVVLDAESGALAKLLPVFRLGLGGPIGGGRQYFSWIHLDDLLSVIMFALEHETLHGPVNATAPEPVTNQQLTRTLGELLRRPTPFPVPSFALRWAMGERAALLLKSQRVVPTALERAGFRFRHPFARGALAEIFARQSVSTRIERATPGRNAETRRATHVLSQVTDLDAPLHEVFPFFSRAQNLGWITPSWMGFAIRGEVPEEIRAGTIIEYDIKLGPLPLHWRTRIARFEPGVAFVDNQERGPYRLWWHEHHFEARGQGTRMVDRVYLSLPFGRLGYLFAGAFVSSTLRRIFGYRAQAMLHRFGPRQQAARAEVARRDAAE